MRYRLGVDVGGTFTDGILVDAGTGERTVAKVFSTPSDPAAGFLAATKRVLERSGVSPEEIDYAIHATTIATNAILSGGVARTALVTTEGFRDILEIGLQIRAAPYDLDYVKPRSLVPRRLCLGVPERLDAQGNVIEALDEDAVERAAEYLREEEVESVAVCLLHSYVNSAHEQIVGRILSERLPEVRVSLSSQVAPEFREYPRASTTVVNAAVQPVVARALTRVEEGLRSAGLDLDVLVMQSSGGVYGLPAATDRPVFMVESGPAAGVVAASHLGAALGYRDLFSFDMGGTTAKVGLVQNGAPQVTKNYEVSAGVQAGVGRGGGYPLRTPVMDLVEIGSGGGSIAWIDDGGALRVGPQSAGAEPGPACYDRGGSQPTVTDANLVLGRLNPDYFLGGEVRLDLERARRAIEAQCAEPLGLSVMDAAYAVVEIANTAMAKAFRLVSIQRGHDPADFVLVGFGGAGPLHVNRMASELGIRLIVVPTNPGVASAVGLVYSDLMHEQYATMLVPADVVQASELSEAFGRLEDQGRHALARDRVSAENSGFRRELEMRYVGQSYELAVSLPGGHLEQLTIDDAIARFHREHERIYGFSDTAAETEIVNLRLTAIGSIAKPEMMRLTAGSARSSERVSSERSVYFGESGAYVDCEVLNRSALDAGTVVNGPAVVEEPDSTTIVHPGYRARVDDFGNLLIAVNGDTRAGCGPGIGEG